MRSVYLDSNSGMPMWPEVISSMLPYMSEHYGNTSSIHAMGNEPKKAMEMARSHVAELIGADPTEVIFTSGATEAVNLALRGSTETASEGKKGIIYSQADHRTVTATAEDLSRKGVRTAMMPLDHLGAIKLKEAVSIMDQGGFHLLSMPFASQEVGTFQPVEDLVKEAAEREVLVHLDLTRSAFQVPIDVKKQGIDLATISSNDLLGPKGVGALYIKKGVRLKPILTGGGHERALRSGSENIPGIYGMGKAASIVKKRMGDYVPQMERVRDALIDGLLRIENTHLNGNMKMRLPNNANVRFDFIEGESILLMLDLNGIQAASGSACSSKTLEPSPTLMAMGLKHEEAHGSIQMTLNPNTTIDDIQYVLEVVPGIVENLREMSPLYNRIGD
ncbi:MAG: cysteine desulfurase family protein [Candidatus Thermoplasmatota archaeon]|nr:cysteine desulfurase family protein [Candidatus Thermoplasmatota archaeon]